MAYRSSKVQIAFLKFISCDNHALVKCIPIPAIAEIIKIGQSSHEIYSNNILTIQESTTILNSCTKCQETYWKQIAFLKFISCDNHALVKCIPIPAIAEIIKIGQSSHEIYSNNILTIQESTTILSSCTKCQETYWKHIVYLDNCFLCQKCS